MNTQIDTTPWDQVEADWLVVGIAESSELTGPLAVLDAALGGTLARLRESGDLSGRLAKTLAIHDAAGISAQRLLLVGLGDPSALTVARLDKAMSTAARTISEKRDVHVAVGLENLGPLTHSSAAKTVVGAFVVGCVGQDLYQSEPQRFTFESIAILSDSSSTETDAAVGEGAILGEAVNLARELVNRPAQDIYPQSVAARAETIAAEFGLSCEVLDEKRLEQERMGSLLAVAVGSDQPPRVVVLEYQGAGKDAPVLALVGKGVTFDSGGLSLKSNDNMLTMKCDMAGAATVLGAMTAIARLKLPVNVTGYLGLVENMVSGKSYKLGDVLTARNGTTIEVTNTDAEGRLVLADVLDFAVDRKAAKMIDLATLTGACVVALGEDVTGVFSNNQAWCDQLLEAAGKCGEDVWQLPMFDFFSDIMKSDVADLKNSGSRWGGASSAAKFLENFVGKTPWIHLDIAGPSFAPSNKPHREGGATGCMVRTLVEAASVFAKS